MKENGRKGKQREKLSPNILVMEKMMITVSSLGAFIAKPLYKITKIT